LDKMALWKYAQKDMHTQSRMGQNLSHKVKYLQIVEVFFRCL